MTSLGSTQARRWWLGASMNLKKLRKDTVARLYAKGVSGEKIWEGRVKWIRGRGGRGGASKGPNCKWALLNNNRKPTPVNSKTKVVTANSAKEIEAAAVATSPKDNNKNPNPVNSETVEVAEATSTKNNSKNKMTVNTETEFVAQLRLKIIVRIKWLSPLKLNL